MVAVFFTFALSGPLPPKEMGVILGVAVLLDATLVRLVLIPVMLRLLGRDAWALPGWLRRRCPTSASATRHALERRAHPDRVCRPTTCRCRSIFPTVLVRNVEVRESCAYAP